MEMIPSSASGSSLALSVSRKASSCRHRPQPDDAEHGATALAAADGDARHGAIMFLNRAMDFFDQSVELQAWRDKTGYPALRLFRSSRAEYFGLPLCAT